MTTKRKLNRRTVTVKLNDYHTEVIVFAKRGVMLYGICRTINNSVLLVKAIDGDGDVKPIYETEAKKTWCDYLYKKKDQEGRMLDNFLRVSTSCFLSNNQLKDEFPELENEIVNLTKELFEAVPKAVRYDTVK